jgi:Arc/MetJ-type ribon-helix-helix transcriptional regulator
MVCGMSTQITVRLQDENVAYADKLVSEHKAASRAEVIDKALKRLRRQAAAERDAEIYAQTEPDPEMQAWVAWTNKHPPVLDD